MRLRFAPSPTGQLHLGGLRTALYNHLLVRQNNGQLILRVEDTDRSMRTALYRHYVNQLLGTGNAYRCFCPAERLQSLRTQYQQQGRPFIYDRHCAHLSNRQIQTRVNQGEPHVIRMHVDNNNTDDGSAVVVAFEDLVYGQVEFQSRLLDDQILLKSDGQPTYHLASVVDDHLMEITHVVRGEEWLSSTPKHLLLYRQLGWKPPQFAHLPLLVNPHDKSKLSKRQNDAHVDWYRQNGWLPEALVNYVALLGWSCGDSQIMSMQELISSFSLQNVSRNSAAVSMDRLRSFNRHYIQQLWENGDGDRNRLLAMLQTKLSGMNYSGDDDYKLRVLEIMRSRISNVYDLADTPIGRHFFMHRPSYSDATDMLKRSRCTPEQINRLLEIAIATTAASAAATTTIESIDAWNACLQRIIDASTPSINNSKQLKLLLRYALTGYNVGAGLPETMWALGKERVLDRLRGCIDYHKSIHE